VRLWQVAACDTMITTLTSRIREEPYLIGAVLSLSFVRIRSSDASVTGSGPAGELRPDDILRGDRVFAAVNGPLTKA
jgi:hypothetical protein